MQLEQQKFLAVDKFWRETMDNKEKNIVDRIENDKLK
jgi:hypothetical protein